MENAEEIMHCLEEFSKMKPKDIPHELDAYLNYVAKTGDPVFKWSIIKCLFREKMLNVITDFYESTLGIELPPCPNVDPFNYERMKANLLEKLDSFHGAPFTVQRISELLTNPRKEYNRADKFMRAIEKNILVGSTREPGRYAEVECDSQSDPSFNGVPEANDIKIEPSGFPCNDLGDPADSSSHPYEEVAAEVRPFAGIGGLVDRTPEIVEPSSVEQLQGQLDSLPAEQPSLLMEDKLSAEFVTSLPNEETEKDGVICSTPCLQSEDQPKEEPKMEAMDVQDTLTAPQSEQSEDSNSLSLDDRSSLQAEASPLDQAEISQPETPLFAEGQEKDMTSVEEPPLKTFDPTNDDLSLSTSQVDVPEERPRSPAPIVPTLQPAEAQQPSPEPLPQDNPPEEPQMTEIEAIIEPTLETPTPETATEVENDVKDTSTEDTSKPPDPEDAPTKSQEVEDKEELPFPTEPVVCFPTDDDSLQETSQNHLIEEKDREREQLDTPPAVVVSENGQPPCRDTIIHTTSPFTEKSETQPMEVEESPVSDAPPSDQIEN